MKLNYLDQKLESHSKYSVDCESLGIDKLNCVLLSYSYYYRLGAAWRDTLNGIIATGRIFVDKKNRLVFSRDAASFHHAITRSYKLHEPIKNDNDSI